MSKGSLCYVIVDMGRMSASLFSLTCVRRVSVMLLVDMGRAEWVSVSLEMGKVSLFFLCFCIHGLGESVYVIVDMGRSE